MPASPETWHVYLALCRDGSLYCGIALSVARRIGQHNAGTGARYMVPSRRPVTCVWKRRAGARGEALRLEAWIKRQPVAVKRALTQGDVTLRRVPGVLKKKGLARWRVVRAARRGVAKDGGDKDSGGGLR